MKILKNKFLIGIITVILIVFGYQAYSSYSIYSIDTSSYVVLTKGEADISRSDEIINIELNQREKILVGDIIKTKTENSIAVIEWGDGSITRIGGDSQISIKENFISENLNKININFELLEGKSWTNVTTIMGKDSSFIQSFSDMEAAIRGTVFEVNLENNYLYVEEHEVNLVNTKTGKTENIAEGELYSIKFFKKIAEKLKEKLRDKSWEDINLNLDIEYFKELKSEFQVSMEKTNPFFLVLKFFSAKYGIIYQMDKGIMDINDIKNLISRLTLEEKEELYKDVMSRYQKLNFVGPEEADLFAEKQIYKEILLLLTDDEQEKAIMMRYTYYDLKDAINLGDSEAVNKVMEVIESSPELLDYLGEKFQNDVGVLQDALKKGFGDIKENLKGLEEFIIEFKGKSNDEILKGFEGLDKKLIDSTVEKVMDYKNNTINAINELDGNENKIENNTLDLEEEIKNILNNPKLNNLIENIEGN